MNADSMPVVLVAERIGFPEAALKTLGRLAEVRLQDLERAQLLSAVVDTELLWVRLRNQIDEEVLAAGRRLRLIASPTTGLNHIDCEAAKRRGIEVISVRGEVDFLRDIRATAEHTIALILSLLRGLPGAVQHVRDGGWDRDLFRGRELYGRTVGVVGHGRLGRIVARYLMGFGCRVLTTDPAVVPADVEPGVEWVELAELLGHSEIVTLHVDLRSDTVGFFEAGCFEMMQPGAYFVNTSRGELVDEDALLKALSDGRLAGAALDVLSGENTNGMSGHPLIDWSVHHENLLVTPHIGGNTVDSLDRVECFLAAKVARWLEKADLGSTHDSESSAMEDV